MPELPEVETIRRGLEGPLVGLRLRGVEVRERRLRAPVPAARLQRLVGSEVIAIRRRAKYLLIDHSGGDTVVVHFGMSGRLSLEPSHVTEPATHDHVRWWFDSPLGRLEMRYNDPRRFGLVVPLRTQRVRHHRLFRHLGPEPLGPGFHPGYLHGLARRRRAPVKSFIMDARVVVGVGNIYASEALWQAGVRPTRSCRRIAQRRWGLIHQATVDVLGEAIRQGGTTLSDFRDPSGQPGYFDVALAVYARAGEPCLRCGAPIRRIVQSGRSTFYCARCQT